MIAFYVAATLVTLAQYVRVRERRLLALMVLFSLLALAHFRGEWDPWGRAFHFAAGCAGLVLLVLLSPRQHPQR